MSKQKLITFKETKNTAVVSNINRSHPRYKSHTSIIHEDKEEDDNEEKHDTTKVRIIDLFKCPSQFAPILSVKGQYEYVQHINLQLIGTVKTSCTHEMKFQMLWEST